MAERRFAKSGDYKNSIRTNGGTVLTALQAAPGSTNTAIATATSLSQIVVDQVLAYGIKAQVFVARADFSGIVKYWDAKTWSDRIVTYLATARTWGDGLGASGALEGSLATALVTAGLASGESEALATALVNALVNESTGETL